MDERSSDMPCANDEKSRRRQEWLNEDLDRAATNAGIAALEVSQVISCCA